MIAPAIAATAALVLYSSTRLGWLAPQSDVALEQTMGPPGRIEKVLLLAGSVAAIGWSLWQLVA